MLKSWRTWQLVALWLVSFGLHMGYMLVQGINEPPRAGSDQWEYEIYAWNLASGNGFAGPSPQFPSDMRRPTVFRTPGVSFYWSLGYRLFGRHYAVPRVMNSAVFALVGIMVFLIGESAYEWRVGALAAVGAVLYPITYIYNDLTSEPLFVPLWLLHLWLLAGWRHHLSWSRCVMAGVVCAAAMLVRASVLLWLPFVFVWVCVVFRADWRQAVAKGTCLLLVPLICIAPWSLRNLKVTGEVVLLSCGGGINLLGGNNSYVVEEPEYYGYCVWPTLLPGHQNAFVGMSDVQMDDHATKLALEWLADHPEKWPFLVYQKIRRLWTPFLQPKVASWKRMGVLFTYGPLLAATVLALIPVIAEAWRRRPQNLILMLPLLWMTGIAVLFFGFARYRFPVEPIMLVITCRGLVMLWDGLHGRKHAEESCS
jgi:hypothetical protein